MVGITSIAKHVPRESKVCILFCCTFYSYIHIQLQLHIHHDVVIVFVAVLPLHILAVCFALICLRFCRCYFTVYSKVPWSES